jgi:hypothetical protein
MFLPGPSAVVEMDHSAGYSRCFCFINLARWTGHPYAKAVVGAGSITGAVDAVRQLLPVVHDGIDKLQGKR